MVGAVAADDDRIVRKRTAQLGAALLVLLDYLHAVFTAYQLLGEILRYPAAAQYYDVLRAFLQYAHAAQQLLHILRRGQKPQLIPGLQYKTAAGYVCPSAAQNRAYKEGRAVPAPELRKAHPVERRGGLDAQLRHLKAAAGEGLRLYRGGELKYVEYGLSRELFGVYDHGQLKLLLDEFKIFGAVFLPAYAGNGVLCSHALCKKAAEHIKLIRARRCDEQLRILHHRVGKRFVVRAGSADAHNVVVARYAVDDIGVGVHGDYLVVFLNQTFEYALAYLAAAYDHDLHFCDLFSHYTEANVTSNTLERD